jgi:hypothetical protein
MARIVLAAGVNADGTPLNVYCGEDYDFAKNALQSMINGLIIMGWVFRNPRETLTLRSTAESRVAAKQ